MTSTDKEQAQTFLHAFEGPEKLLELWFAARTDEDVKSLRTVQRSVWEEVLELVHCSILSVISNGSITAYLLSESSFFVFDEKVILKTCGTTTLLGAVPKIIEIACACGLTVVDVFYSRQNFFFPHKQLAPYTDFKHETEYLDGIFDGGCAYQVGRINGAHYNFYNAENRISTMSDEPEATIEVLMSDLDQDQMRKLFYKDTFTNKTSKDCGIHDLLPGAQIDEFIFDPYGYSMNAIRSDGAYATIHVTPQQGCSYASFETNLIMDDYTELIKKVLAIFNPAAFLVAIYVEMGVKAISNFRSAPVDWSVFPDFKIGDRSVTHFQHYDLTVVSFESKNVKATAFSKPQIKKRASYR